jgi:hypothetical protein
MEQDGGNLLIHFSALCKCGKEHVGSTLPAVEIKIHHTVAAQLGLDLVSRTSASRTKFVVLRAYPQGGGVANFVMVEPTE